MLEFWEKSTAEKLILENKKKSSTKKKKNNYQLCKKHTCTVTHVLWHTLWNIIEHYVVHLKSLKPVVSTLIQYLLDRDTFNHTYPTLCTGSAVAYNL